MIDYILAHRMERDRLLGIPYQMRDGLDRTQLWLKTDLIKVVTGPRRAGKSVFALLLLKQTNFAYVNFEDEALGSVLKPGNYDDLIQVLHKVYPGFTHILFDEVQNLAKWEIFLNKLHRRGYNLVVTGSNANLLGQELATSLTGRVEEILVLPFGFGEYLKARPEGSVGEYLRLGGYPEVVVKGVDKQSYTQSLIDSIVAKDVTRRFHVNRSELLYQLNGYLLTQFACEISYTQLAKIFHLSSANTIVKYMRYLQTPYLYFLLERYSYKAKLRMTSPRKLYLTDTGFAPLGFSADTGRLLENAILLHQVRRGLKLNRELFSYRTRNQKEVDFVMKQGTRIVDLIQVCADLKSPKVFQREMSALVEAGEELECNTKTILTLGPVPGIHTDGIKVRNVQEWLLE